MPEHTVEFEVIDPNSINLPAHLLHAGGGYRVDVRDGDVYISGNSNGLLYLAEVLVQCAKGDFSATFHVHLSQDSTSGSPGSDEPSPELVIFAGSL